MTTSGPSHVLHVLLVMDVQRDAELLISWLESGGYSVTCARVQTADALRGARSRLSDFAMLEKPFTALVMLQATHDILASRA